LLQLFRAWRPLGGRVTRWFTPSEPVPQDTPFAPTDMAQLLRVRGLDRTAELDDPTWRDLLLERYLDTLSRNASIFGRQVLYRRLRAGADAHAGVSDVSEVATQRARVSRLLDAPEQL